MVGTPGAKRCVAVSAALEAEAALPLVHGSFSMYQIFALGMCYTLKFRQRRGRCTGLTFFALGPTIMANLVVWVDIPVLDLDRAMRFYSAVLASEVRLQENHGMKIGLLPGSEPDVFGCLFAKESERPSDKGPVVYLSVQGRLDDAVAQVEAHGGTVLQARHQIGPYGFRAVILDSEGNRVALHSM
jgi:uncharacterized protein